MSNGMQHRRALHDQRGFTLSELVLVLVVVAGLLIVATTSIRNIRKETRSSNCQTELRTLKLATEQYHSENDAYPIDKTVLVAGSLVAAADVANWTVEFEATDETPTYRAVGNCA